MRVSRIRLWFAVVVVALVAGGGSYLYKVKRESDQVATLLAQAMLHGYPARPVDAAAWKQVHAGMTKQQVSELLGKAAAAGACRQFPPEESRLECWEYGFVSSVFAPVPDNRSHVVYFDTEGRVSRVSAP